jgi:prophage tail gpP-like protein
MANMKLMKDIAIHRHVPRMIIVIHDLCKKRKLYAEKKQRTKMPSSRVEGKSFGLELKQELWRAFLLPLVSTVI